RAARKHHKPLSVCGELAANPVYARKLIQEGIHAVSVAPKMIPGLRIAIKNKLKITAKDSHAKIRKRVKITKKRNRG
ncbi:MAG: hypothetical protein PHV97_03950, partial [Candidatus Omnitrophica bacterium]|nr:hypothetical protein [Candidatus Omnitrophota bacterium]